ncbi:MAG: sulfurtransferase-like selenium metabolism protein YedF [Peptoclostridium sp.]|uniref:sulfurtransferase-like selenium metabolism protein YedF n=1 Tax=Peptoclostridium sp. TaxID=1904860 RepID=UPI00139BBD36|nr:sulfurtransferase-like selenium metabolism protein YedF [Peptoclostridium sp.]MZQ74764.1 sulfurtransferase-like selenium metabolism protein YedF [Peptoclostridium sp.]
MMIQVDARGLACPQPVILAKKALEASNDPIMAIVDNETAKENIIKLAKSMNCEYRDYEKDGLFYIEISKGELPEGSTTEECGAESKLGDTVIFVQADKLGRGDDELGALLMRNLIYTLTESEPYPKAVLFVNGGATLTTVNEHTVENLRILEGAGVKIVTCGTCLDVFGLKEKLSVGVIGNMYDIVDNLKAAGNTITIG